MRTRKPSFNPRPLPLFRIYDGSPNKQRKYPVQTKEKFYILCLDILQAISTNKIKMNVSPWKAFPRYKGLKERGSKEKSSLIGIVNIRG